MSAFYLDDGARFGADAIAIARLRERADQLLGVLGVTVRTLREIIESDAEPEMKMNALRELHAALRTALDEVRP